MILENSPEVYFMGESLDVSMAREGVPGVNAVCLPNVCGLKTSLCLVSDTSFNCELLLGKFSIWAG